MPVVSASQEAETRAWLDPEIQGQLEQHPKSRQLWRCMFVVIAHKKLGRSIAQDRRTAFQRKKICLKWSRAVALFSFDFVRDARPQLAEFTKRRSHSRNKICPPLPV